VEEGKETEKETAERNSEYAYTLIASYKHALYDVLIIRIHVSIS